MTFPEGGTGYFYCTTNEPGPGQMIEIYGDKGKLTFRDGQLHFSRYKVTVSEFTRTNTEMWGSPPREQVELTLSDEPCGHFSVLKNFARHILRGEPLFCAGDTAVASLELANAITLSSYTGREVTLPIDRRAYDRLLADLRKRSTFKKTVKAQRITDPNLA
jgi:predicted dehydrogenase